MIKLLFSLIIGICCIDEKVANYLKTWYENMNASHSWTRSSYNNEFNHTEGTCAESFSVDYIIVGGGSAGCVLASRLSENENITILLIEAGGEENDFNLIPGSAIALKTSNLNWGYLTTPQNNACLGMVERRCDFSRGKCLGGSSSINSMLYVRGNKNDFDEWVRMGNIGWSYEDVKPYFLKSENAIDIHEDPGYHGHDGPLTVSYTKPIPPYYDTIIAANEERGLIVTDYNGISQMGVSRVQSTIKNGVRDSLNQAYLQPALKQERNNLILLKNALVTKLIIDSDLTARGVYYSKDNKCQIARSSREVILSAGTVNTPQLLMLSGIGASDELKKHGIPKIADLPVGKHLSDHFTVYNIPFSTNVSNGAAQKSLESMMEEYVSNGTGFLAYEEGLEVAYYKTTILNPLNVPDIEVKFNLPRNYIDANITMKASNYDEDMREAVKSIGINDITIYVILLSPKSEGEVTLKSKDPLDFPDINPNYLSHIDDINTLVDGVIEFVKIVETEAFKKIDAKLKRTPIPHCDEHFNIDIDPRGYWECYAKYKGFGMYHPVATCRMGNSNKTSVVDNNLFVHGIKNLRVVDASVIPQITTGHLNAAVVMIAERIADLIKDGRRI